MRKAAFAAADAAWGYAATDWVVFVDGTEGLSTDVPHDALEFGTNNRYRYLYDEATAAAQNYLDIAVRIFMSQGTVTEHTFTIDTTLPAGPDNQAVWWQCNPQYVGETSPPWRTLRRMGTVAYWRGLVDWTLLDTYQDVATTQASQAIHTSIISYSYARYSEVDYYDPTKWVQANDIGWANRIFMSGVPGRTVPELPLVYSTPDPPGMVITIPPGPARILVFQGSTVETFNFTGNVTNESGNEVYTWAWGDGTANGTGQTISHSFPVGNHGPFTVTLTVHDPDVVTDRTAQVTIAPGTANPITEQTPPAASTPPTRMLSGPYCYYTNQFMNSQYIMAFSALFRRNPRDGVWWTPLVIGPIPTSPVDGTVAVDQAQWDVMQPNPRNQPITVPDQPGPGV
jgi:hypothetical protein